MARAELFSESPRARPQSIPPVSFYYNAIYDKVEIAPVLIPHDCNDGFLEAYWQRPDAYFDAGIRDAMSVFTNVDVTSGLTRLKGDLDDSTWLRRNGHLLGLKELDLGNRIVTGTREH